MALKTLNQMLTDNPNLLSFVVIPKSAQGDLDAATLKTAIIRRCGDVEPYYQMTADFVLFGTMWFSTHGFLFDHAIDVWNATYNPIENYNRLEDETVTGTRETSGANTDTHSGTDTTTTSGSASGSDTHSGTDTTTTSGSASGSDTHSGTDTTTTSGSTSGSDTHGGTDTTTTSGSKSGSEAHTGTDTITDNVTRENEIAGFDSATYQDANKETETGTHGTAHGETITTSGQESGSESIAHGEVITKEEESSGSESIAHGEVITKEEQSSGSESIAHGEVITKAEQSSGSEALAHGHKIETESEGTEETETTRASHVHGNIGVTTSQQMIEAELALANKFWIYDYIASAFETDNFITVYNSYYDSI